MARKTHQVSPAFNVLAQLRLEKKSKEIEATEARRAIDQQIEDLPEFKAIEKERGSVSLNSDMYQIALTYMQNVEFDLPKIAMELPGEVFARIFPSKPEFSATAYKALIEELAAKALTDAKTRKLLDRVKKSMEEHRTGTKGATQVKVTPFTD